MLTGILVSYVQLFDECSSNVGRYAMAVLILSVKVLTLNIR